MTKQKAFIFDIDGTLLDIQQRLKYLAEDPINWNEFLSTTEILKDTPIDSAILVANQLAKEYPLIFVTGRNEGIRDITKYQLCKYLELPNDNPMLFMRNEDPIVLRENGGKHELDFVIKRKIYLENIEPLYDIIGVFEDKTSVVEMWRSLGLKVFQVEPPKDPDGF